MEKKHFFQQNIKDERTSLSTLSYWDTQHKVIVLFKFDQWFILAINVGYYCVNTLKLHHSLINSIKLVDLCCFMSLSTHCAVAHSGDSWSDIGSDYLWVTKLIWLKI